MRPNCCHVSLAFVLKLLNFLQAFVGVSILVYSAWMLSQWNHHIPIVPPPPSAPSPDSSSFSSLVLSSESAAVADQITPFDFAVHLVSGFDEGSGFGLNSLKLPAPWFIYSFMGLGILLCCVTFIGCIAAAAINGCCLCFYTILITMLTLLEAALVAFILIDRRWEKDLPFDPTGELDSFRSFVEENIDICRWVGLGVIVIQVLSLLLSITLRGMLSTHKPDYDVEDDYDARARTREPLLKQQLNQASGSTKGDGKQWRSQELFVGGARRLDNHSRSQSRVCKKTLQSAPAPSFVTATMAVLLKPRFASDLMFKKKTGNQLLHSSRTRSPESREGLKSEPVGFFSEGRGKTSAAVVFSGEGSGGRHSSSSRGFATDGKGTHSDIWSSRIRDKYGLSSLNQNASPSMKSKQ